LKVYGLQLRHTLHGPAVAIRMEGGAQDLVPLLHFGEGFGQCVLVDGAGELETSGNVVGAAGAVEL
jgi:hypothetical protein